MILADYFRYPKDSTWDIARQCGVEHGVIRLPETSEFDLTNASHWKQVYHDFINFGIKPMIIEPMPNELHDHIKIGDEKRDESIEKVIKMFPIMEQLDIRTICFNWMAHIGWLRNKNIEERGGATVTGFCLADFIPTGERITETELWDNYEYFLKAVIPYAEKYGIQLALHPDDPPMHLGNVARIMTSYENIDKAINKIVPSKNLGVTMCQATYHMMGEDLYKVIPELAEKIFFVHFRNCRGTLTDFQETFHDNGDIKMAEIMKLYKQCGVNVPIRVDHVPTLLGENSVNQGYDALGRLYAIGYLKGMIEGVSSKKAKRVDLVMFMGQSNMAGRGDASISTVVPEGHGYEFRAISDPTKLYPVEEPFGVDENNTFSDVYETTKTGSLVSAFIEEYYQQRKVPIVGVSCSKGGTGLDFWAADGAAIEDAIERHGAARTWLEENGYIIENDFMVWCQGETDGGRGMDAETYATGLTDIIEKMVSEAGIDFCAVIRIGHARDNADRHIQIIEAQTELCKTYDKAVLVSTKFAGFGAEYMKDEYHYTQPAYNEVGKEAGMNTACYIEHGKKPSMYDPQYNYN